MKPISENHIETLAIERAKDLLRNTQSPIVEVAFSSGFSSQSHLSNWFLKLVGVSPATYRRQGLT